MRLRIASVDARLEDVYLSFHDLLRGDADRMLITGTEAEAFLSYDDLNRYLDLSGRSLSLDAADPGELRVVGSADVLGRTVQASADVEQGVPPVGNLAHDPVLDPSHLLGQTALRGHDSLRMEGAEAV